ncbi:MAG: ABC transporter substrate-binding protein [Kiritimatiellaeota bacterium]|nr:ABC transporter substrate-binding protein [Kiritimatiellota bacterium]
MNCIRNIQRVCAVMATLAAARGDTVRRCIDRVPSMDPVYAESVGAAQAVGMVYDTLLAYDYAERPYRLKGSLAETWAFSEDGLTLTFHLRNGTRFGADDCFGKGDAEGREVVADDVVYSLKRLADAKLASPCYWILEGKIKGLDDFREASRAPAPTDYDSPVEGLLAMDRHTVRLTLTRASPFLPWALTLPSCGIVPREAVAFYGAELGHREVGSGPFRLASWRRNYRMVFERREYAAGGIAPHFVNRHSSFEAASHPVDRVVMSVMDDATTRWMSFLAGELDVERNIPRDNWDAAVRVGEGGELAVTDGLARKGIRLLSAPSLDTYYIGINMDDPVLGTNTKLRQALNCAFDFPAWATLWQGRVAPALGPVPPTVAGAQTAPFAYAFDIEKAKRLLAEAGYPGGIDPATGRRLALTLDVGRTDQETRESCELLAAFFDRIGISLAVAYHSWPAFLQKVSRRESQLFRVGWVADYPDAENFLQLFYGKNASPGPNRCNYANPAFDALYEEAVTTLDETRRLALYRELQDILREDCPWVYLYHRRAVMLLHDRLDNVLLHDFPYGAEQHWRLRP